ncbi:MAG: tetratricopeptide repeat protein [Planctomycetes bacterium]|nr:tetratricopeptide repeat protein [Planctomycetota bacterium]
MGSQFLLSMAVALAAQSGSPSLAPSGSDVGRLSLEQLLERTRAARAEAHTRLEGEIDALSKEIEAAPSPRDLAARVDRLVALGAEATPLIVRRIDPGSPGTDRERLRALQFANALGRMDTAAVTTELIETLKGGTPEGRRNALRALASTREIKRVRPEVEALFRAESGQTRQLALRTLLSFGGPENNVLFTQLLGGGDDTLIGTALDGLTEQKVVAALEDVRKLLNQVGTAPRHAQALLRYFQAVHESATQADVLAFVRLAQSGSLNLALRVELVNGLAPLNPTLNVDLKKSMEPLVASSDRQLKEAAQVLLARLGDKSTRREILKEYDELVVRNERWAEAYVRRADIYVRLGDDDEAIKDFRQAFSVGRDDPTLEQDELSEKLARAYVRKGKLKDAADLLNRAPISLKRLGELALDPEFASLRNSKYAKDAFGTK